MLKIFVVVIAPGKDADSLLSEEVKRETNAQVMTLDEARQVGFGGLPEMATGEVRLVAVNARDAAWIHRVLETSDVVGGFQAHDVDG